MVMWGRGRLRWEEALQRGWCWERPASSLLLSLLFLFLPNEHLVITVSLLHVRWPVKAGGEVEAESPGAWELAYIAGGFVLRAGAVFAGLARAGS